MKQYVLFLVNLIVCISTLYAQREADNWYFGSNAGITFKYGAPVALNDGILNQSEGVATISDGNGNLLFYTDGSTIWNRNHAVMETGLYGDNLSAQSAVIVQVPGNRLKYLVFTVSNWPTTGPTRGLFYSIIDMALNGGLGGVTNKNHLLNASPREQVTAAFHSNCSDIWIVSHEKGNSNFLAYLFTSSGISTVPVVSNVGMSYIGTLRHGYLRFSSDGTKLCSTLGYATGGNPAVGTVELYDFDKTTGVVSNPIRLASAVLDDRDVYSSEFSADNSKLYVCAFNKSFINQYDLSSGNAAAIIASAVNIAPSSDIKTCLQMGPDRRIYVSKGGQPWLGVINDPDKPGASCGYVDNAVSLNGRNAQLGLPNFMQGVFSLPYLGVDTTLCAGASLLLDAYTRPGETYAWQDGSTNQTFNVTAAGTYWVDVTRLGCTKRDQIKIVAAPLPVVDLGPDISICGTTSITLNATAGTGATYEWHDGTTTPTYTVNGPGNYSVKVTERGCVNTDAIAITAMPALAVNLGNDTAICAGANLLLDAVAATGNTYKWHNGVTTSSITVSLPGKYWVDVTNNGCLGTDTIVVTNNPSPVFELGNDTTICSGVTLTLNAAVGSGTAVYTWRDGSTASNYAVTTAGDYWVEVRDRGCSSFDTIAINTAIPPTVSLGNDTAVCAGATLLLDASAAGGNTYLWNDGSSLPAMTASLPGEYWVEVSNGCAARDTILLRNKPWPAVDLGEDTLLCTNSRIVLDAGSSSGHTLYQWQDGSAGNTFTVTQPGEYWVQVTDDGCVGSDTVQVMALPVLELGPDTTLCMPQTLLLRATPLPDAAYVWQDGSTLNSYLVNRAGTYKVEVDTDCGVLSDVIVVKYEDCQCRVHVPNAFSPDRNLHNDIFKPVTDNCLFTEYRLTIYNRWGERVFESMNASIGWDGSSKGHLCDVGAYVYVLSYRQGSGDRKLLRGTLMLVR